MTLGGVLRPLVSHQEVSSGQDIDKLFPFIRIRIDPITFLSLSLLCPQSSILPTSQPASQPALPPPFACLKLRRRRSMLPVDKPVDIEAALLGIRDASSICLVAVVLIVRILPFIYAKLLPHRLYAVVRSYINVQSRVGILLDPRFDMDPWFVFLGESRCRVSLQFENSSGSSCFVSFFLLILSSPSTRSVASIPHLVEPVPEHTPGGVSRRSTELRNVDVDETI
jgi:hypothetical protein